MEAHADTNDAISTNNAENIARETASEGCQHVPLMYTLEPAIERPIHAAETSAPPRF